MLREEPRDPHQPGFRHAAAVVRLVHRPGARGAERAERGAPCLTILLKRKPGLTQAQFVEHHKIVHAPLFISLPVVKETVRHYVQQHGIDVALPGMPPTKYDGITELWFDDEAALARCFSDADYLARVRPDEESFLDLHACDFVVSRENVVMAGVLRSALR